MQKFKKIFKYSKINASVLYNSFTATTSIPGFKFTNSSESSRGQQFFWHVVLCMSLYTVLIICFGFYDQFENKAVLTVLEILDQGERLPFPAIYLCPGYPLNPEKMQKIKKEMYMSIANKILELKKLIFIKCSSLKRKNFTKPWVDLDGPIQSALRFQRSTRNDSYNLDDLFQNHVDFNELERYLPHVSEVLLLRLLTRQNYENNFIIRIFCFTQRLQIVQTFVICSFIIKPMNCSMTAWSRDDVMIVVLCSNLWKLVLVSVLYSTVFIQMQISYCKYIILY